MEEVSYAGVRTISGTALVVVWRGGKWGYLDPRYDLRNHSPCGFEWGYQGSGPAQLALALLADALQDDCLAQRWYQRFKREVVCCWQKGGWEIGREEVRTWLGHVRLIDFRGAPGEE